MIEETIIMLIKDLGFPIVITLMLLIDKFKTNGNLLKVVENNNSILRKIELKL